ncbi:hypothetical protein CBOM_00733 [Ceraceosorus bombacis]|uniref:GH16 domain-containing protein n=1 Tax=Ceraceosorus bombacis TaxID=401625 RepID=A0A0N7L946_9BASI|nr:hypothetical protein CBOM_00733 [Ceraceosorus bombacis]
MPTINPHYSPLVPGANLSSDRNTESYGRPNAAFNRQPASPSAQTPLMHSSSLRRPSPTGSAPSSSHSSGHTPASSTRPLAQPSNYGSSSSSLSSGRRYAPGGFTAVGQSGATAMAAAARTQRDANASGVSSLGSNDSFDKRLSSASEKYSYAAPVAFTSLPDSWGRPGTIEDDDYLHDPKIGKSPNSRGSIFTLRGLVNIGTVALLAAGLLMLFGGYPLMYHILQEQESNKGGFGMGGTNSSGQIPENFRGLIDPDTPRSAYRRRSIDGQRNMNLVFSDEFNVDGRSFYPGDDPFWEAVDLHYWGTGDYEWYDPSAVTTEGGNMVITMIEHAHRNMNFRSGMVQSWNKFCFTGGHIEFRVRLPGAHDIPGLWPAAWTMGNLGRAGHGASTEGYVA